MLHVPRRLLTTRPAIRPTTGLGLRVQHRIPASILQVPQRPRFRRGTVSISLTICRPQHVHTTQENRDHKEQGSLPPISRRAVYLLLCSCPAFICFIVVVPLALCYEIIPLHDENVSDRSPEELFSQPDLYDHTSSDTNPCIEALKRKLEDDNIYTYSEHATLQRFPTDAGKRPRLARILAAVSRLVPATYRPYELCGPDTRSFSEMEDFESRRTKSLWIAVDADLPDSFIAYIQNPGPDNPKESVATCKAYKVVQKLHKALQHMNLSRGPIPVFIAFRELYIRGEYWDGYWRYVEHGRWVFPKAAEPLRRDWEVVEKYQRPSYW
ncbi:hypothetical protein F4778DRAFT_723721 [Xylariomycetidae sp. FL2044]|nr:hypothetical protein F4778DRAFT_723721 [Xylariomycetidae sp. FL2044]